MRNRVGRELNFSKRALLAACSIVAVAAPVVAGALEPASAMISSTDDLYVAAWQRLTDQERQRAKVPVVTPEKFDKFAGTYRLSPLMVLTFSRNGGKFYMRPTGWAQPISIYPEGLQNFFATMRLLQVTFRVGAGGHADSLVLHNNGSDETATRIEVAEAVRIESAFAKHMRDNLASPSTESVLRRAIDGIMGDDPDYAGVLAQFAVSANLTPEELLRYVSTWGRVKSVVFHGVDQFSGWDVYVVVFEHAQSRWNIALADHNGTIDALGFAQTYPRNDLKHPSPGTQQAFWRFLRSYENKKPDYSAVTPSLVEAERHQMQLPFLDGMTDQCGTPAKLQFVRVTDEGLDVYAEVFPNCARTWHVAPLTADGKLQSFGAGGGFGGSYGASVIR